MANLLTVGVTSGVPSSGTGTVSTIDNLLALGLPISNGSTSLFAALTGAASSATSSMVGLVVSISPNSVNTNGQKTMANSAPVTMASDQTAVPSYLTAVSSAAGLTVSSIIISTGTNSTLVSSSPRQLYKVECFNNSATIDYLHMYNLSSAPTAGSSLVFDRFMVPSNTAGAGVVTTTDIGVPYTTGLSYTFTAGIADSDTTAISSNASYIVNLYYK